MHRQSTTQTAQDTTKWRAFKQVSQKIKQCTFCSIFGVSNTLVTNISAEVSVTKDTKALKNTPNYKEISMKWELLKAQRANGKQVVLRNTLTRAELTVSCRSKISTNLLSSLSYSPLAGYSKEVS